MSLSKIFIENNIEKTLTEFLNAHQFSQIAIIVDENTKEFCYPLLKGFLPTHFLISVKSGEVEKNLNTCTHIWNEMTAHALDRKSLVINLGGGVIGDMGGFCASTYKRGVAFVQIPTTLLSMVDASVGGKLGIDFEGFKNHIGVFNHPLAVFIDPIFLKTLDSRELRSGFAEVIKHSLIADYEHWKFLKIKDLSSLDWLSVIKHSINIKSAVVDQDPNENGLRKILNFGHTIGHAIESHFLEIPNKRLLHGEAIAIGMIAEAWIAMKKGFITTDECKEISNYILTTFEKLHIENDEIKQIIPLTLQDKKNQNGEVQFALLEAIGRGNYEQGVSEKEMIEALNYYNSIN